MSTFTFTALNLKRITADFSGLFFSVALPVVFYLLFGAIQDYGDSPMRHGNAAAYIMVAMATYGAIVAVCSQMGATVVERTHGWGRQLALTALSPQVLFRSQCVVLLVRSFLPVVAVFLAGVLSGARMEPQAWALSFILAVMVAIPFGLYGQIFGMIFRAESAVSIAATLLVVFAFLGNVFTPLSEWMMSISRFTPMYGAVSLARYPVGGGDQIIMSEPYLLNDSLWIAVVNVMVWTLIFGGAWWILCRRGERR